MSRLKQTTMNIALIFDEDMLSVWGVVLSVWAGASNDFDVDADDVGGGSGGDEWWSDDGG